MSLHVTPAHSANHFSANHFSASRFSASRFDGPADDDVLAIFDDADDPAAILALDAELQALRDEHGIHRERHGAVASPLPSANAPTRSIEVFPARSLQRLRRNVAAVRSMLKLGADFVTVTYGAAGSRPAGTKELVGWLVEAGVPTYAHLTCHAKNLAALDHSIDELIELGVAGILALRGDQPADGTELILPHATDLVARIRSRATVAGKSLQIAVAAFPTGHPDSADLNEDAANVARKQDAGADFAITQNFFEASDYERFMALTQRTGATIPVVPGLTPTTTVRRLTRIAELSELTVPLDLAQALTDAPDDASRRSIAVQSTANLCRRLIDAGAPGIQLFTMNDDETAIRVFEAIDNRSS